MSKIYGPTVALVDARLRVEPGTIHGLLGENGAGKSTLVRILAGVERADGGSVHVLGEDPHGGASRPRAFIHQDLGLFPTMSVASNMALGNQFERRFGLISDSQTEHRAAETLARLEMKISPRSLVGELTLADQTAVAIARALHSGVELIVLDEPTAYLDADQVRGVMRILTRLRSESVACLLITHRANDVLETCDEVTVLRDGETVAARPVAGLTSNELVRIISGHEPTTSVRSTARTERRPVLEVTGLRAASTEPVDFEVGEGEIVALCGLADAGTRTVARALFGIEPATSGAIAVDGTAVTIDSPASAIRAGIASVPLDRRREGIAANLSVRENLFMKPEGRRWTPIRIRWERLRARDLMRRFLAVPVEPERPMSTFSGGNQQKAVIAKWWNVQPKLLILNEPTAGVDLAAKADIHALLREYSEEHGLAVLLVSSDFGEIADVADRVYVMRHGRIIKHVESAECDARELVALAYGEELG
ncbi:sugar ABC transporter ATP-binding protein [Nocardioides hungaricus]